MEGIVRWFNPAKGYGFIEAEGKDYFAHFKAIQAEETYKNLIEGQYVTFTPAINKQGGVAENIIAIEANGNVL